MGAASRPTSPVRTLATSRTERGCGGLRRWPIAPPSLASSVWMMTLPAQTSGAALTASLLRLTPPPPPQLLLLLLLLLLRLTRNSPAVRIVIVIVIVISRRYVWLNWEPVKPVWRV